MPVDDLPEALHGAQASTLARVKVRPRDDHWLVGTLMVAGTTVILHFGHALGNLWRVLPGVLCLLFALRALLGLWTLGFVHAGERRAAFFERGNQTLLGVLAALCAVLLLR